MSKRIVIIGGGISGLTAGIYAQKAGFESEIYEKNSVVGGECTGWDRQGFHIDNCIHWLMGTTEGTGLNQIWTDVGAIGDGVEIIKSDKMYTSELDGQKITLWLDLERTRHDLLELSPEDKDEINKLMDFCILGKNVVIPSDKPSELLTIGDIVKMNKTMKEAMALFKAYSGQDTQDLMNRFKHPLIRCMISDFCPKESMASSFPMAYGNFTSGDGGIPRGASRAMALRMQKKYESIGGKVFINSPVKEVNIKGKKVVNIILSNGQSVEADYFICSCDPSFTFQHLLDSKFMDKDFAEIYSNRLSYPIFQMFQVAFSVDSPIDALQADIMINGSDIMLDRWPLGRISVKNYAYEPSFAPAGKQIIQVLTATPEESHQFWVELYKDKEAYKEKKIELATAILNKLESRFPEYCGKMQILDVWTPMTYQRYCNAYKGYNQAYIPTKYGKKNLYPSAWIKGLDNFLLAGQWLAAPGGLPGAAIQGKYAVQRIQNKNKIVFTIGVSLSLICTALIMLIIAITTCRINSEINYSWGGGFFHGCFAIWNYIISIFTDRLIVAPQHTSSYLILWWIGLLCSIMQLGKCLIRRNK